MQLDPTQAASAEQFNRQSDRYGKSHILADVSDIHAALDDLSVPPGGRALDVATGGGHTALFLARQGWNVTVGDIAPRMIENTLALLRDAGLNAGSAQFPAEEIPFPDNSFELVTVRVATHHFSDPDRFLREVTRILVPGGHFMLIDGSVPDGSPVTEEWLHNVEKWRDPSHGRFHSPSAWRSKARAAGLSVLKVDTSLRKQPDLEWYFETANTSEENRALVRNAVATAPAEVREKLDLANVDGRITWSWTMVTLLAVKT